jgi:hypothetical protein
MTIATAVSETCVSAGGRFGLWRFRFRSGPAKRKGIDDLTVVDCLAHAEALAFSKTLEVQPLAAVAASA